jgi:hypothetical protein
MTKTLMAKMMFVNGFWKLAFVLHRQVHLGKEHTTYRFKRELTEEWKKARAKYKVRTSGCHDELICFTKSFQLLLYTRLQNRRNTMQGRLRVLQNGIVLA